MASLFCSKDVKLTWTAWYAGCAHARDFQAEEDKALYKAFQSPTHPQTLLSLQNSHKPTTDPHMTTAELLAIFCPATLLKHRGAWQLVK